MWLLNQDRDAIYKRFDECLTSVPIMHSGQLFGLNLFMGEHLLGTYDSLHEIMAEMTAINLCDKPCYIISGHSSYDGVEDFDSLCAYIDEMEDSEYEMD